MSIEQVKAGDVRAGQRVKAPDSAAFHEIKSADLAGDGLVRLDAGWGALTLPEDAYVHVETDEVDTTDAAAYVGVAMRSRLDHVAGLLAASWGDPDQFSNDELLELDIGYGVAGPLSAEYVREAAEEHLDALPLAVEATTTFEVVLGTGGPDDRLLVECAPIKDSRGLPMAYEIRRIVYRYSWSGSGEVELVGEDRAAAETFARRVVPELVE